MLRRVLAQSRWVCRSRLTTNPYERVTRLAETYGKFSKYFEDAEDSVKKYADEYDKHKQRIDFDIGFYGRMQPRVSNDAFVAPSATLAGNVEVWDNASIWYGVTIRGDRHLVRVGWCANVQDNTVIDEALEPLAPDHDGSTIVGHSVTVGHSCLLRGTTVEDGCVVGMGSKLLEGSYMEKESQLGANSTLERGQRVPAGELWAGSPARFVRALTDEEIAQAKHVNETYHRLALQHREPFELAGTQYQELERRGIHFTTERTFPW